MPKTATATPPAVRWRAPAENGVAHAFPDGKAARSACGLPWTHPRWDWSRRSRCELCVAAVEGGDELDPLPPRHPRR